jgi:hypothetical protein
VNRRNLMLKLSGALAVVVSDPVSSIERAFAQTAGCSPAQQHTFTETGFIVSPCSQQSIQLSTQRTILIQDCRKSNGSSTLRVSNRIHGTGQGYELGTGIPTGTQYILNEQNFTHEVSYPPAQNGCAPDSMVFREHGVLVSQGSVPNEQIVIAVTLSIDASCQVSSIMNVEANCHG